MSDMTYEGEYVIRSDDIFLLAEKAVLPPEPTYVSLYSTGSGPLANDGHIHLNATGELSLQSGASFIEIDSQPAQGNIAIVNGMTGSIVVSQGGIPGAPTIKLTDVPPSLQMSVGLPAAGAAVELAATGLKLSYGPPAGGASIELGPTGVTIKYGAWSVALTAAGIDLAVGPNKLSLQPQGVELNGLKMGLAAVTNLTLQGLQIQETAAVKLQGQAAITMLG